MLEYIKRSSNINNFLISTSVAIKNINGVCSENYHRRSKWCFNFSN